MPSFLSVILDFYQGYLEGGLISRDSLHFELPEFMTDLLLHNCLQCYM